MYDEITNLEQYNDHQSKSHFEKKKKKKDCNMELYKVTGKNRKYNLSTQA